MSQDAIEYITPAPHLLPLVPRVWLQTLMQEHRAVHREWGGEGWFSAINQSSGVQGVMSFSANGEVGFHRDEDFARYGYLLVLRPANYNVTGLRRWRGTDPQQKAGDLICFHQQRRLHALVRQGTERRNSDHLHTVGTWAEFPGRLWCALTLENDNFLTPDEAAQEYEKHLNVLAINKKR